MLLQYVQQYVPSIQNGLVEVHYCQIGGLFVVCCHKGHTQLGSLCHLLQVLVAKAVPPQVRSGMGTSVKLSYQELCVVVAPELSKDLRLGCNVAICVEDTDAH